VRLVAVRADVDHGSHRVTVPGEHTPAHEVVHLPRQRGLDRRRGLGSLQGEEPHQGREGRAVAGRALRRGRLVAQQRALGLGPQQGLHPLDGEADVGQAGA
jgi:hypothetical protein